MLLTRGTVVDTRKGVLCNHLRLLKCAVVVLVVVVIHHIWKNCVLTRNLRVLVTRTGAT